VAELRDVKAIRVGLAGFASAGVGNGAEHELYFEDQEYDQNETDTGEENR
jgi:hypothetical protein